MKDINCLFPVKRLAELADAGEIKAVAQHHFSGFMGRIYKRDHVINVAAPALVEQLKKEKVDILLVAPACPLDHQHGGLVARVAESAGIPTVSVITGKDISASTNVPR